MNTLTLYSFRRCPFAIRARMVLEEKEIPYQRIEEDLSHLSPELLSLHPEGRVPLLIHQLGDSQQVIYQSSIITEYLDEVFPTPPLMPQDAVSRAKVRLWTYGCDALFKPDLDLYKYGLASMTDLERNELGSRLRSHLLQWETALKSRSFLVGHQITLADIHLFPFARQWRAVQVPPAFSDLVRAEDYPRLGEWLDRMTARPAFVRAMSRDPR